MSHAHTVAHAHTHTRLHSHLNLGDGRLAHGSVPDAEARYALETCMSVVGDPETCAGGIGTSDRGVGVRERECDLDEG